MVYVISQTGKPLMPTKPVRARILLKKKKAIVINRSPFTIQLTYESEENTQEVIIGIDSGYKYIGFSVITEKKELICGEITLLNEMRERLKEKAMYRKQRRTRLRYRKARWSNRKREPGWLAPSIQHKLDSHIRFIDKLCKILPITKIVVEVANFDIQSIKEGVKLKGKEYQEGEQKGFWNLREYILHRDNHTCQVCGANKKNTILEVHHIGYWKKDRTDRPSNLMTLCSKCHTSKEHKDNGKLYGLKPIKKTLKEATFMSIVRCRLINILKEEYPEKEIKYTYGYITKSKRIELKLTKNHYEDAFCIAGGERQDRVNAIEVVQVKRNSRSLEKFYDAKIIDIRTKEKVSGGELNSGRRTRNKSLNSENLRMYRGETIRKGRRTIRERRYKLQPYDLVKYESKLYYVQGVQNKGAYVKLKGLKKVPSIKKITLIKYGKGFCFIEQNSISAG